jgi:ATP-binding cassette subfamily F protein 3
MWRKQGGPGAPALAESAVQAVDGTAATVISAPAAAAVAEPPKIPGRLNPIKLRQMKERQGEIEEEVTRLETEIADYEAALANFVSVDETRRITGLLDARRADLNALLTEWEEVGQAIEASR